MTTSKPGRQERVRRLELLAAVSLFIVLLLMLFEWNMLRGPIERRVSAATGREFHIYGDLDVDLSMKPRVTLGRMTLANVPGALQPQMATVDSLDFRFDLAKSFVGDVVLSDVLVGKPDILLEKDAKGRGNWTFPSGDAEWPTIQQLSVDAGRLVYRNLPNKTDMQIDFASGDAAGSRLAPLIIQGKGRYAGNPLQLDGRVESPLELKDAAKPYQIDLKARAGATRATASGGLVGPLALRDFNLDFGLSGPNLALLYPLIGVATPDTPPYQLKGRLSRKGRTWHYDDFAGTVGDSDLAGDASVDPSGERPFLRADLVSKRLDFDDLAGFVGAPPQTAPGETASEEQKIEAAKLQASARVLPDDEFKLEKLRNMDADVKLRAQRINAPSLPIEAMTGHLFVDNGVLRLDPLDFKVAGGEISSVIRLDARGKVIASSARIQARGLQLPKLFPGAKLTEDSTGRIAGSLNLVGNGNSVANMLATSDGEVGLIMGSGRISNLLLEFAGIDIAEALKFLITGDRVVPIRCAFADFEVKQGVMESRRLAFDTTDTVIYGEGSISLRDETLDLRLKPQPKDRSFLSLRAPLRASGSFKDPAFRPDYTRVTLRGVAAAVLGSIAPPAALLAVFESGPGKDIACRPGPPGKTEAAEAAKAAK
jgi:uncharacterized protein involved in outer membrane biogenesis